MSRLERFSAFIIDAEECEVETVAWISEVVIIAAEKSKCEFRYQHETHIVKALDVNSTAFDLAISMNIYGRVQPVDPKRSKALHAFLAEEHTVNKELEAQLLSAHIKDASKYFGINDPYVSAALRHGNPDAAAKSLIAKTKIYDLTFRKELLEKGPKAIAQSNDPLLVLTRMAAEREESAVEKLRTLNARMSSLRSSLGLKLFDVYGLRIPPDATFSLRIADGRVKPYNYNGTQAPIYTTFYGLYDRYYSFQGEYPWALPDKWMKAPPELLKEPMNFVSTNDIIGGNSGSPIINRNREVVGLIFDGNMESLPGDYIYLPESARSVSVHAGGIVASLRYIYNAERIAEELLK